MYGNLTFAGYCFSALAVFFAALSGRQWYLAAKLPLPIVPADLMSPTVDAQGNRLPISLSQEADRRHTFALYTAEMVRSLERSAKINRDAAWRAVFSAFFAAAAFALPIARDYAVWMLWLPAPRVVTTCDLSRP